MNIKGLRAYKAVMSMGTLSAAANAMNISESALSRQLSIFEADIGLTLFSRDKQKLVPTEAGESFFREAERVMDVLEQLPLSVESIRRGLRQRIRLAISPRFATGFVPAALAEYLDRYPDTDVSIDVQPRKYLERWLANEVFDLGIGALPASHTGISVETVGYISVVCVLHPDHPLSQRDGLDLSDLQDECVVTLPRGTTLGQKIYRQFEKAKVTPARFVTASQTYLCCTLAAERIGVGITDSIVPQTLQHRLKVLPLRPALKVGVGAFFPRNAKRRREIDELCHLIKAHAQPYCIEI